MLTDRVAIVTGAGQGIGRAIALDRRALALPCDVQDAARFSFSSARPSGA